MLDRNEMILRDERYAQQAMMPYMPQRPPSYISQPEPEEPSLLSSIFRHIWLVIGTTLVVLALACLYLKKTPKQYGAHSDILIETSAPMGAGMGDGGGGPSLSNNYLNTQCTLIKSSTVLAPVVNNPEIAKLPTFGNTNPLAYLHDNLSAEVGHKDDVITVSILSPYASDSALLVNTIVDAYIDYENRTRDSGALSVLKTLETELATVEASITQKTAAMADIQQANPNVQFLSDGQANSPAIIRLNQCAQFYAAKQNQRADAQIVYGAANPQLRILQAQEEEAYRQFQDAQRSAMDLNKTTGLYTKLKSDLDELRVHAAPLRERINGLNRQRDLMNNIKSISVLEVGETATKAAYPPKVQTIALGVVLGLMLGSFFAFIRDRSDGRLRSADEIQNLVGLSILGVVPRMPGRRTAVARAMAVHLDPRSQVAEAYRTIRTTVYFGPQGTRARTLLVTSPEAGDGKTTSASNLAIAIAQTGRSVLLLDADFRKPTQHKNLDVKDSVGLSSVLSGAETLDRAIQRTGVDGLDILPCGAIPSNPSEILNSQEFGELVDRLALKYDHILFDSPPVNLVTDARILGAVCDATLLVLRADKSTRKAAEHARNALLSVGAKLLGAIVNDVPKGKGYETYGGSYYGQSDMRGGPQGSANVPAPIGYLGRLPRNPDEVREG